MAVLFPIVSCLSIWVTLVAATSTPSATIFFGLRPEPTITDPKISSGWASLVTVTDSSTVFEAGCAPTLTTPCYGPGGHGVDMITIGPSTFMQSFSNVFALPFPTESGHSTSYGPPMTQVAQVDCTITGTTEATCSVTGTATFTPDYDRPSNHSTTSFTTTTTITGTDMFYGTVFITAGAEKLPSGAARTQQEGLMKVVAGTLGLAIIGIMAL
jgi:hypothetical protein